MVNWIIGGLVLLAAALAAGKLIRDRRSGRSACTGCSGCVHQRNCPHRPCTQEQPYINQ